MMNCLPLERVNYGFGGMGGLSPPLAFVPEPAYFWFATSTPSHGIACVLQPSQVSKTAEG